MTGELWSKFEDFWDKEKIEDKAKLYQDFYDGSKKKDQGFTWVSSKDQLNKESNAAKWGIPNHVLGDVDNTEVIIGLFNPGTHMDTDASESCNTVREYIQGEVNKEKENANQTGVDFESKEIYEGNSRDEETLKKFYYDHILSEENVIAQELKKLYKMYENNEEDVRIYLETGNSKSFKLIAYYLGQYYGHLFDNNDGYPGYVRAMKHYIPIFEKMNEAKRQGHKNIDENFEKAVNEIKVANIELVPYRTSTTGDIGFSKSWKSSRLSAQVILNKLENNPDTIVILRSRAKWESLFIELCGSKEEYFEKIEPKLFELGTSGAISIKNVTPVVDKKAKLNYEELSKQHQDRVDEAIDKIKKLISLESFENDLDDMLKEHHK
ncbi:hypothetical protein [Staphylococcus simiae]|uniref:Uncharacterized protein n=1 Tax=Staphylococcus simiae CCM 7213 = CCUG 51256 TaxID=911238 RepID=G5JJS5_9STAP|nr:hypothetical protein [Staphylococcus simiae]EHJ07582.1 hypothetical protein SS7213T_08672 [Staphylococcus simiae CCM 7213 = CCUG 51256]PNZ14674.1 hypothetical protein CD113_01280 [Staphylococcus simiae]SNV55054.1 Uncharacterised protein [Staphylococcus simiae]